MSFALWHKQAMKKVEIVPEWMFYFRVIVFSALVFGGTYAYTSWMKIPNVLNKSVADTSVILMGMSMLLTSVCYFWNFLDSKIIYRKYLGLVGFAYAITHVILSFSALQALFGPKLWQTNAFVAPLTGLLATVIFSVMAIISNRYALTKMGGRVWRSILRLGYLALLFGFVHVYMLKSGRWITWFNGGMKTPPSMSLMVSIFILIVIVMRVVLWISLMKKSARTKQTTL